MPIDLSRDVLLRWEGLDPELAGTLKEGGVTALLVPGNEPAVSEACRQAGLKTATPEELPSLSPEEMDKSPSRPAALRAGQWPGLTRHSAPVNPDEDVASASHQPWIDANSFWIADLRAMYPQRTAVLGYQPNEEAGLKPGRIVPYDSLELGLIEAWAAGGNYVLTIEPRYRKALLSGDKEALAAWQQLGRTAAWLRKHQPLLGGPISPIATLLVADDITAEIANLMFRQNVSPRLVAANALPAAFPGCLALVACSVPDPAPAARKTLQAYAHAGGSLIVDAPGEKAWWRTPGLKPVRAQEDRDFYAFGRGQIVAYREQIADPSEFAFDVIDVVNQKRRAVRLWNASSVIAVAASGPKTGPLACRTVVTAVNYGSPIDYDVPARVQGFYAKATLLRPNAAPLPLKPVKRGTTTEVLVPQLKRLGVIVFS